MAQNMAFLGIYCNHGFTCEGANSQFEDCPAFFLKISMMRISLLCLAAVVASASKCKLPLHQRLERFLPHQPSVFQDLMLPMRDGVKLHTIALSPLFSSKKKWPTVIDRSPYGRLS